MARALGSLRHSLYLTREEVGRAESQLQTDCLCVSSHVIVVEGRAQTLQRLVGVWASLELYFSNMALKYCVGTMVVGS